MQQFYYSKSKHIFSGAVVTISMIVLIFVKLRQSLDLYDLLYLTLLIAAVIADIVLVFIKLKYNRRVFSINNNGFTIDKLNGLTIPWSSIKCVRLQCIERSTFKKRAEKWCICIYIKDIGFLNKLAAENKRLQKIQQYEKYKIELIGMENTPQEIYNKCTDFIKNNCPEQAWQEYAVEYNVL